MAVVGLIGDPHGAPHLRLAGGPVNQYQAFACSLNTHISTAQKTFTGPNVVYLGGGEGVSENGAVPKATEPSPLGPLCFLLMFWYLSPFALT